MTHFNKLRGFVFAALLMFAGFTTINAQETTTFDGFKFTFNGVTNNGDGSSTWSYTVKGMGAEHDLSHWVLALCEDISENDVLSASPNGWEVNTDPRTGVYGIKWDKKINKNGGEQTFTFTLSNQYGVEPVQVAFKASTDNFYGNINGPACDDNGGSGDDCADCAGKVTTLTLKYNGN